MISPLRGLAWIGGSLLVLGLAGGVAFFVFVRPTPLPPVQSPTPRPELSDETGWYRLPNGPCALVTYSAQGGLALASMEDSLFFDRMARASEREFQWHRATRDTLHVRFLAGEEMRAFAWTAPDEATRQARGCDGPFSVRELNFSFGDVLLSGAAS